MIALVSCDGELARRALDIEFDVVDEPIATPEGQRAHASVRVVGAFAYEHVRRLERLGKRRDERRKEIGPGGQHRTFGNADDRVILFGRKGSLPLLAQLGQLSGQIITEDILGRIFARFCVGK